jgi:hypothetical protein
VDESGEQNAGRVTDDVVPRERRAESPVHPAPSVRQGHWDASELEKLDAERKSEGEKRERRYRQPREHECDREVDRNGIERIACALVPEHESEMKLSREDPERQGDQEQASEKKTSAH